jgi:hypothetical protein
LDILKFLTRTIQKPFVDLKITVIFKLGSGAHTAMLEQHPKVNKAQQPTRPFGTGCEKLVRLLNRHENLFADSIFKYLSQYIIIPIGRFLHP